MPPLDHLEGELQQLERAHLLRVPRELPEGTLVLCSNDYLGYAAQPLPLSAEQLATLPSGSGASRLISGSHASHRDLEATLADWVGHESALGFSAGFAANIGVIAALAGDGDAIISDALNHASIIDGCRLSRARVLVAKHDDLGSVTRALEDSGAARRRYVITETYFSMDGRTPDLAGLRAVCDEHDAVLVVDEAHALGVFGARGAGQ